MASSVRRFRTTNQIEYFQLNAIEHIIWPHAVAGTSVSSSFLSSTDNGDSAYCAVIIYPLSIIELVEMMAYCHLNGTLHKTNTGQWAPLWNLFDVTQWLVRIRVHFIGHMRVRLVLTYLPSNLCNRVARIRHVASIPVSATEFNNSHRDVIAALYHRRRTRLLISSKCGSNHIPIRIWNILFYFVDKRKIILIDWWDMKNFEGIGFYYDGLHVCFKKGEKKSWFLPQQISFPFKSSLALKIILNPIERLWRLKMSVKVNMSSCSCWRDSKICLSPKITLKWMS